MAATAQDLRIDMLGKRNALEHQALVFANIVKASSDDIRPETDIKIDAALKDITQKTKELIAARQLMRGNNK